VQHSSRTLEPTCRKTMDIERILLTLVAVSALTCSSLWAQTGNGLDNPDWKEEQAPPPPAFSKDALVKIDMPPHVSVKVGVDPNTVVVGSDGVVRYVVVMINASGSVNAAFEGIRCASDEVKTYARWSSAGTWAVLNDPPWKGINDNMPSKHAYAFARQGACDSRIAANKETILSNLKNGKKTATGSKL
jgi:CNP1-like family